MLTHSFRSDETVDHPLRACVVPPSLTCHPLCDLSCPPLTSHPPPDAPLTCLPPSWCSAMAVAKYLGLCGQISCHFCTKWRGLRKPTFKWNRATLCYFVLPFVSGPVLFQTPFLISQVCSLQLIPIQSELLEGGSTRTKCCFLWHIPW